MATRSWDHEIVTLAAPAANTAHRVLLEHLADGLEELDRIVRSGEELNRPELQARIDKLLEVAFAALDISRRD